MSCFDMLFCYLEYILFNGFGGFDEKLEFTYNKNSDDEDDGDSDSDSDSDTDSIISENNAQLVDGYNSEDYIDDYYIRPQNGNMITRRNIAFC